MSASVQANGFLIHATDEDGWTSIATATLQCRAECITFLAQAGTSVDQKHKYGWAPIHIAAVEGDEATIRALIEAGASLNDVTNGDEPGQTPVMLATKEGRDKAIIALLSKK